MAVLAASICTRGGKALLSRQFRDLSKERVVSLLAAFPTLLSDATKNQHTTVEDEHVRYVYQALEDFYVVLITNRQSNILQDIDTLHLFTQSITSILRSVDEREIFDNCFEILSLFDEIISMGYKENLTLTQILTFLEMDSHEERIQELIEKNKEMEAAEERKRKAIEIKTRESRKKNEFNHPYGQRLLSESQYGNSSYDNYSQSPYQQPQQQAYQPPPQQHQTPFRQPPPRTGGLQLDSRANKPFGSDNHPTLISTPAPQRQAYQAQAQTQQQHTPAAPVKEKIKNNGVLISVNEKFSGQISREGSVTTSEVKGELQLRINNPELAQFKIELELNKDSNLSSQYKTHPDIDKPLFNSSSIVGLKNPNKPYPSNDQSVCVLRWRSTPKSNDDSNLLLPISFTTWINLNEDEQSAVFTFEYELLPSFQESGLLDKVEINLPITNGVIENDENDNIQLEYTPDGIKIELSKLNEFPSGSFEISSTEFDDEEKLFPIEVEFDVTNKKVDESMKTGEVSIKSVKFNEGEEDVPFDLYYNGTTEGFYVV